MFIKQNNLKLVFTMIFIRKRIYRGALTYISLKTSYQIFPPVKAFTPSTRKSLTMRISAAAFVKPLKFLHLTYRTDKKSHWHLGRSRAVIILK